MVENNRPLAIHIGRTPEELEAQRLAMERWLLKKAHPNDIRYQDATEVKLTAPKWLAFSMQQLTLSPSLRIPIGRIATFAGITALAVVMV